jgi:thiamine kinase-like enzyme
VPFRILNDYLNQFHGEHEILSVFESGSSGSLVSCVSIDGISKVIKIASKNARVKLAEEKARNLLLRDYISSEHLPSVNFIISYKEYEIMVTDFIGSHTLHGLIMNQSTNEKKLVDIWSDFIRILSTMWTKSANEYNNSSRISPRNFEQRFQRIKDSVKMMKINDTSLSSMYKREIKINEVYYPSIYEAFRNIFDIDPPQYKVFCHGDPQPSNIIVANKDWYLIDWEWCGWHDWRMMFSHLYGWWFTRCSILSSYPQLSTRNYKLQLEYQLKVPDRFQIFIDKSKELFQNLCFNVDACEREKNYNSTRKYLSLLYLGELRFLENWNRSDFAIPLIGEALKVLYPSSNDSINSLNKVLIKN